MHETGMKVPTCSKTRPCRFYKNSRFRRTKSCITCNAICPGYVKTPLVEKQVSDQAKVHELDEDEVMQKVFLAKHAIKEFIPVETIAAMCLFLLQKRLQLLQVSHYR
jgi:3-hydroxybutyrate dehydrogenase